jgi:6-phosphogluconolactonase/glucosamine-6-phosphate isomerase/deaminase
MRVEVFDSKRGVGGAAVRGARKARAVRDCLESEVSPLRPASARRLHGGAAVYLDCESATPLKGPAAEAI